MPRKKKTSTDSESLPETQENSQQTAADKPRRPTPAKRDTSSQDLRDGAFPIIGIGTSAGGLEALEAFFRWMPPRSSMAFVVVQHLDPTHASILVDLIRRFTPMKVFQVEEGMAVQPDCIYIIPPNRDMALMRGQLHLMEPVEPRGLRLPIDFFFRSLAEDLMEKAICIVLSGTGSDGTLGLKEIRGAGGMVMVQDPETAKYDGMPRSAIATGIVDYILPPERMPEQLIQYTNRFFVRDMKEQSAPALIKETDAIEKVFILLRRYTKHDFSLYKRNTINRRIERRMAVNQIKRLEDYLRFLRQNPHEVETLFQELLISVTSFFRDPDAFEALEQKAIPQIIDSRRSDQPIRIWVPGCSTGEEAYSIAILIREQMSDRDLECDVHIFATDIDEKTIETARLGVYPDNIAADVSPERLQRFFIKEDRTYRITKQIREMVVFAVQSITEDPPFSRMDLISCRNLLIYLGAELQKKVIPLFHYGLKQGGFLFLGTSETLGEFDRYFQAVDRKAKLFQRTTNEAAPQSELAFALPSLFEEEVHRPPTRLEKPLNVRELTAKMLLKDYTPPCLILDDQSEILFFHGRTADFLDPANGEASLNILRMVREDLRLPISAALRRAFTQHETVQEKAYLPSEKGTRVIRLTVRPIDRSLSAQSLYMVIFEDELLLDGQQPVDLTNEENIERDRRLKEAEHELQSTKEYLQTTIEELETTNEELKSTNEELQSANEELQSTNEEMETAKEELQSVNEELVTVNSELQSKIDELVRANNDLNNLLANVEIGIVFLDEQLNVQRFNASSTRFINLINSDVGRPLAHIVTNLIYDELVNDARQVLDTLIPQEVEVQTSSGQWFLMRIRPYRTTDNVIAGLVITFSEITQQKKTQDRLTVAYDYIENVVSTVREPLVMLDENSRVMSGSHAFYRMFDLDPETSQGQSLYEIAGHQLDIPAVRELLEIVVPENEAFYDYRIEHDFTLLGRRVFTLNVRRMCSLGGDTCLILLAFEDITGGCE